MAVASVLPRCGGGGAAPGEEVQVARTKAARAEPIGGSVTQSSDTDTDGVTRDMVTVEVTDEDDDGVPEIRVSFNGDDDVVDTEEAMARMNVDRVHGQPIGTHYFERVDGGDYHAVEFYRSLDVGDLTENDGTDVPAGDLWVDVYTDFDGDDITEDNYLAGGIWVYIPDDGDEGDYEFGAFADGAAPYPGAKIAGLAGTAQYDGNATGVYSDGRRNEFFDASVELTADFGADSISGRIYDVEVDDERVAGNPRLMLGSATLTAGSNFFTGDTTMEFEDEDYTGKWGGQFYNDPDTGTAGNDTPGAVAGTFGGANEDEDKSFVGVFGAYNEE